MKNKILLCLSLSGMTLPIFSQDTSFLANGPNAPQVGDIVPESVTFYVSPTPVVDFPLFIPALTDLESRNYADFPDEVVVTLYHTPW